MKLTDLKDLRVIKKELTPEPEKAPAQNQPRRRTVELRSKEEEHARNEVFAISCSYTFGPMGATNVTIR